MLILYPSAQQIVFRSYICYPLPSPPPPIHTPSLLSPSLPPSHSLSIHSLTHENGKLNHG